MTIPPIEMTSGECAEYRLLADESDPHRVRFWHVTLDTEQLTLQALHEPDAELTREGAPWHELHDMLTVRPALLEEIEELRTEITQLQHECTRLRAQQRRLKQVVDARQSRVGRRAVLSLSSRLADRPS